MGLFYFLLSKPAAFSLCIACLWPHSPPFIPHSTKAFRSMQTWTKPQLLLLFSFFSPLRNHLHKTASFCGASFNFCVGFFVVFFGGGEFWGKPTAVNLFPFGLPWTMMPHVDLFFQLWWICWAANFSNWCFERQGEAVGFEILFCLIVHLNFLSAVSAVLSI